MRRKPLAALCACALLALALAPAAFADGGGFVPVEPRSSNAESIRDAYYVILGVASGTFVLVEAALLVFVFRFRRRGRPRDAEGPQLHGNTNLELAWTVVPVLILAGIVGFVLAKLPDIESVPAARAGEERVAVKVVAHQYYWQFEYENGAIAVDRLRAPLGRVVTLDVTTPDVVHSWWIPALGGKIDAIPGKTTHTWFRATKTGTFRGQCAEFCGVFHALMLATVEVMPPESFDAWLASRAAAAPETLGEETYRGACAKCHGLQGEGGYGPRIAGSSLLGDAQGLEELIRQGRKKMPPVARDWGEAQVAALLDYMQASLTVGSGVRGG